MASRALFLACLLCLAAVGRSQIAPMTGPEVARAPLGGSEGAAAPEAKLGGLPPLGSVINNTIGPLPSRTPSPPSSSVPTGVFNSSSCDVCTGVPSDAMPGSGYCVTACVGPCCTGTWTAIRAGNIPAFGTCNNNCKAASKPFLMSASISLLALLAALLFSL